MKEIGHWVEQARTWFGVGPLTLNEVAEQLYNAYNKGVADGGAMAKPKPHWLKDDCPSCDEIWRNALLKGVDAEHITAPRHDGMPHCQSGSIASGGNTPHCTCDTCW